MNKKLLIAAVGAAQANVLPTVDTACESDPIAADAIQKAREAYNAYTEDLAAWNAKIADTVADATVDPPVEAADGLTTIAGAAADLYQEAVDAFENVANTQGGAALLTFTDSTTGAAASVVLAAGHPLQEARDTINQTKQDLDDLEARLKKRETPTALPGGGDDERVIMLRTDAADAADCVAPNTPEPNRCRVMTVNKTLGDVSINVVADGDGSTDDADMRALILAADEAAAELAKYDSDTATVGSEALNIAVAVDELADLEAYATWRSTEFGAKQTAAAAAKTAYEATASALVTANDKLARIYQRRGRDAIDAVITFDGTTGSTIRTTRGEEIDNDEATGYGAAANQRVSYVAAAKDVTWIELGTATFAADQTNTFARFPDGVGGTADDLANAQSTAAKLSAAAGDVTVKSVNPADKTVVITTDSGTDLQFPMEALTQTAEQVATENVNWPRTTRTADALSIRSKHYYTTGIQNTSTCVSCFYSAVTDTAADWVWDDTCNKNAAAGGEDLCSAIDWKSDYTLKAEQDAAVDSSTGALYTAYHTAAVQHIFQDDHADVTSDTAADLFVAEFVQLTKHRMMRALYRGGCVIGSDNGLAYKNDRDGGTATLYDDYVATECPASAPTAIADAALVAVPDAEQKYDMQLALKAASEGGTDATSQINRILGNDQVAQNVGGGAATEADSIQGGTGVKATIFALATNMHAQMHTRAEARWNYQRGLIEQAVMENALSITEAELDATTGPSTDADTWAKAQKGRIDTLVAWQVAQLAEERAQVDQSLNAQDIVRAKALIAQLRTARDPLYATLSAAEDAIVVAFEAQQAQIVEEEAARTQVTAMDAAADGEEPLARKLADADADIDRFKKRVLGLRTQMISDQLLRDSTALELSNAEGRRDGLLAMQAQAVDDYTREVAMCKSSEYQQAQRLLARRIQQAADDATLAEEVAEAYADKIKFAPIADAEVGGESNADCSYPAPTAEGEQAPRPLCKETFCCGAAQKFLKDGTKLTVETCQLEFGTQTYTYYPPLAEGALTEPEPETWRWQCISGAQKLVAAATAALAASYMMA